MAFGLTDTSRLRCQVRLTRDMDGLTATLPAATRNMFVDGPYLPLRAPLRHAHNSAPREEANAPLASAPDNTRCGMARKVVITYCTNTTSLISHHVHSHSASSLSVKHLPSLDRLLDFCERLHRIADKRNSSVALFHWYAFFFPSLVLSVVRNS